MALFHHDTRDYDVAASEAATKAREKIEAMIDKGRHRAATVVEAVHTEVPHDRLVRGAALDFQPQEGRLGVLIPNGEEPHLESVHRNALAQLCDRAPVPRHDWGGGRGTRRLRGLPVAYARDLEAMGEDGQDLLAENLRRLYQRDQTARFLTRSHTGTLRGFLSDRYRRLDSRPLLDAFTESCQDMGLVPVEGYAHDTRVTLKALMPLVFEPVPNEVMAFGVVWGNSDYGNGAHSIRAFVLRLWCTNLAITEECMRQVHLGGRLPDSVALSARTYELDTAATASAIGDVVRGVLSPARVDAYLGVVRQAAEENVEPKQVLARVRGRLTKAEAEEVVGAFNSPDVENLPPGNTAWRMSNAISWVAGKTEDEGRRLDLMREAGRVLPALDGAAAAVVPA